MSVSITRREFAFKLVPAFAAALGLAACGVPLPSPETAEQNLRELLGLQNEVKRYFSAHPEVLGRVNAVKSQLTDLGFYGTLPDGTLYDPTPTNILTTWDTLATFQAQTPEKLAALLNDNPSNLADRKIQVDRLTGRAKQRMLNEEKHSQLWQVNPDYPDEQVVHNAVERTLTHLFGNISGNVITAVKYPRPVPDDFQKIGATAYIAPAPDTTVNIALDDDFSELNMEYQKDVSVILERLRRLWTQVNQFYIQNQNRLNNPQLKQVLLSYKQNALTDRNHLNVSVDYNASTKARYVSRAIRGELGHALDPLMYAQDLYTLEEQLFALEQVTRYLQNHPNLIAVPEQNLKGKALWYNLQGETFDIGHLTFVDHFYDATDHDLVEGKSLFVTDEQKQMVDAILAKSGFNISINSVLSSVQSEFNQAMLSWSNLMREGRDYQEVEEQIRTIEQFIDNIVAPSPSVTVFQLPRLKHPARYDQLPHAV